VSGEQAGDERGHGDGARPGFALGLVELALRVIPGPRDADAGRLAGEVDRNLFAVAVGAGGLVGVGIAVDRTLNDVLDVNVENNEICVNVAVASATSCNP